MKAIYSNGSNRWNYLGDLASILRREMRYLVYIRYLWSSERNMILYLSQPFCLEFYNTVLLLTMHSQNKYLYSTKNEAHQDRHKLV
jgi:hypothetical protein